MQYNVLKGRIILISYNRGCEMRSKCLKILLLYSAIILSGCNNNNTENDSARDFLNATQKETVISAKEETSLQNENADEHIELSKEFLEKRYPDKTILSYMYAEPQVWNGKTEHRYSDEQMVAVNDYLVENGADYVIYFMPVALENMTLEYVLDVINGDNPPDIITSVGCNDVTDNSSQKMVFNGIYEDLDKYSNTDAYQKLTKAYPSGLYNLSLYNGTFYGFKTNVFSSETNYYIYNKDVADKYGIKKSDVEGKSLSDIIPVLNKLKGWESDYKYSITTSYLNQYELNFIEPNFYFDNYDSAPVFWLECIGVDANTNDDNVITITDSKKVRKDYEALYEMYQQGYSCINGIKDKKYYYSTTDILGDVTVNSFLESSCMTTAGKKTMDFHTRWDASQNMEAVPMIKRYTTDIGGWSTINGVCSKSNNKEKALEAMATICSDKMLSEIMVNGTESAGYEVKNYTPISNDLYTSDGAGNMANQYLINDTDDTDRQLAKESMKDAKIDIGIEGYYFDLSAYKEKVVAIRKVEREFLGEVNDVPKLFSDEYGSFKEAWNDFDRKLKEAGADEIVSEINKQRIEMNKGLSK
jgi:ABC-type glycerol-3-phosphate transport system substrate-binding protein